MASEVEIMKNREQGGAAQNATQSMSAELKGVEAKVEELIQTYKIREIGFHQDMARERDNVSDELYESLRRAKALNQGTTRDMDASFSRPESGSNHLKRVALPKFGGKPKAWPDIHRGFKAIIGACNPAIEMARLRHALPEAASKFILGICSSLRKLGPC